MCPFRHFCAGGFPYSRLQKSRYQLLLPSLLEDLEEHVAAWPPQPAGHELLVQPAVLHARSPAPFPSRELHAQSRHGAPEWADFVSGRHLVRKTMYIYIYRVRNLNMNQYDHLGSKRQWALGAACDPPLLVAHPWRCLGSQPKGIQQHEQGGRSICFPCYVDGCNGFTPGCCLRTSGRVFLMSTNCRMPPDQFTQFYFAVSTNAFLFLLHKNHAPWRVGAGCLTLGRPALRHFPKYHATAPGQRDCEGLSAKSVALLSP